MDSNTPLWTETAGAPVAGHGAGKESSDSSQETRPQGKRILMIQNSRLQPFPPALNLARFFSAQGAEFTFASFSRDAEDSRGSLVPGAVHYRIGLGIDETWPSPARAVVGWQRFIEGVCRLAETIRPHLTLGCWGGGFAAAWWASSRERTGPLVFWANEFIRHSDFGRSNPMRYVVASERELARQADMVVVADPVRGRYQGPYLRIKRWASIGNFPVLSDPDPGPSRLADAAAEIRRTDAEAVIFCFTGSICRGARVDRLLDSMRAWPDGTYLLLAGSVDQDLPTFSSDLAGLGDRARYLGRLPYPEIERGLPSCDVGVALYNTTWPWVNELYCAPCKVGDYVKGGLSLLLSANETLVGLLEREHLGVTVDPQSADSIAAGAIQVVEGIRSGQFGRARVLEAFRSRLCLESQMGPLLGMLNTRDEGGAREGRVS